ncbi:hypothetical protein KKG85_01390 [Patescibacteria group bacterium]|nr:hypothetical protein [Patescibacteria group bacterium]
MKTLKPKWKLPKQMFWEIKTKKSTSEEIDIKSYDRYILLKGNILEKRELLTCVKSQLVLANKKVVLGK